MKTVGYCSTRNLYPRLATTINSLLTNNPNIDRVICLLEDDELETLQDKRIQIINANSIKNPFWKFGPNYDTVFTYMALMRLAFSKILPDVDRILYLDVDTIVNANIEELFEIDMKDKAVCGIRDKGMPGKDSNPYVNSGVLLMNLDYIRNSNLDDRMIEMLNTKERYLYPDQDVMNIVCANHKGLISDKYNTFSVFDCSEAKIIHYAGFKKWWESQTPNVEFYKKYKCVSI